MHFTYMKFNSVHAFKAQNIAFREDPRKRAGMHPNSEFGLQKHQLFDRDFHSFSRNHIKYVKWGKMMTLTETLRCLVKTWSQKVRGAFIL